MENLERIRQIDPLLIQALPENNIRFKLHKFTLDALMGSILETGGVEHPGTGSVLPQPGPDGKLYKIHTGNRRLAAVLLANREHKAGLLFPMIIVPAVDELHLLKEQIRENVVREQLNPMDEALAIDRLLNAGVPKVEVRAIFSKPGGRKGRAMTPVSNSYI